MNARFSLAALAALALAIPASANARFRIDSVPAEYAPLNSPTTRELVTLSSFYFEVNQETSRARVVAIYTYPDQMTYGPDDAVGGPRPTVAQIPGLKYDAAAHEVVYDANGSKVVCATVSEHTGPIGHHLAVKSTGACTVSSVVADHTEDDGWSIHRSRALDTYFEVR